MLGTPRSTPNTTRTHFGLGRDHVNKSPRKWLPSTTTLTTAAAQRTTRETCIYTDIGERKFDNNKQSAHSLLSLLTVSVKFTKFELFGGYTRTISFTKTELILTNKNFFLRSLKFSRIIFEQQSTLLGNKNYCVLNSRSKLSLKARQRE